MCLQHCHTQLKRCWCCVRLLGAETNRILSSMLPRLQAQPPKQLDPIMLFCPYVFSFVFFLSLCASFSPFLSFSLSLSHMHINTHTCAMWMHKWCGSTGNIILPVPWPYPACLLIDWLYPQGPQLLQITSDFLQSPRQRRLAARLCIPFAFPKYPYHIASHKFTVLSRDEIAPFLPGITHGNMVLFCFWTYCIW